MSVFLPLLFVLAQQAKPEPAAPPVVSPAEIKRTCSALDAALRDGELKVIEQALEAAREVPHADVVKKVRKALADERIPVRLAALQTLRWLPLEEALDALHELAKERKFVREPELCTALFTALGQHADARSIPAILKDPFDPPRGDCVKARLFALARIRERAALEGLFEIVGTLPKGNFPRPIQPYMKDARLALAVLTGVDQGESPEAWEAWWREQRKGFQVAPELPVLPQELQTRWANQWGLERGSERGRRREDRGQD